MSNDSGNKRLIDNIQDENDTGPLKALSQATNEEGVVNTNNNDTGLTTEVTTQESNTMNDMQRPSVSKLQERQRGQRIFGMLMGTLNQFDKAQKQNEEQARKRQAIDTKQQERLLEEKKAIQASLLEHQQKRAKLNQHRLADLDEKRMKQSILQQKNLAHYLVTNTAPHISYLPKQLLRQQQEQIDQQLRNAESPVTATQPQQENDQDQNDKE